MKSIRFSRVVAALSISAAVLVAVAAAKDAQLNPAATPAPRNEAWWRQRHESMNARVQEGDVDLIFIGDSITHGWEDVGKEVWQRFYGSRNAVNLGIGGDQTCHVLWRLDHGNLAGISPKLAVIMIGTNNAGHMPHQSPEQIAAGVKAIVGRLRTKLPQTKILLLAIFPRGADNGDAIRQINVKANQIFAKLADGKQVFYLDIGPKFLCPNGDAEHADHARSAAPECQGLRNLGRSHRADGGQADGHQAERGHARAARGRLDATPRKF